MTLQKPEGYEGHMAVTVVRDIKTGQTQIVANLYPTEYGGQNYTWSWEHERWVERGTYEFDTPDNYAGIELPAAVRG